MKLMLKQQKSGGNLEVSEENTNAPWMKNA